MEMSLDELLWFSKRATEHRREEARAIEAAAKKGKK